jgi:short-subunit dehydrogenase
LALITGASSGIGYELAKLFGADGYDLVVAADDEAIHGTAEELSRQGIHAEPAQLDLCKPKNVDRLYRKTIGDTRNGRRRLDAAALNAGIGGAGPFVERPLDDDLAIIDLNARSTVHLAKLVLSDMSAHGTGKLLFTSSVAATMPGSLQTVYYASKSFIQSFAEALHDELRHTDITVTALMPGPTDTNFFRRADMLDTVLPDSAKAVGSRLISESANRN